MTIKCGTDRRSGSITTVVFFLSICLKKSNDDEMFGTEAVYYKIPYKFN